MSGDLYQILGVSRDASADDIKSAYRKLAKQYHPDVNPGDPTAEEKFKEVSAAYDVLSDPAKRARYDQTGRVEEPMGGPGAADFFQNVGFGDLFEAFFGQTGPRSTAVDGDDLRAEIQIELKDVLGPSERTLTYRRLAACETCGGTGAAGGTRPERCRNCDGRGSVQRVQQTMLGSIRTSTPCPVCQGAGQVIADPCRTCQGRGITAKTETLTVTIPAGVDDGNTLRVVGKGSDGIRGGQPGDLFVIVRVAEHERFERDGQDLHVECALTFTQAVLGDQFELEGLSGPIEVTVPAGTQPNDQVRIKGEGLPRLNGGSRGSLFVHFTIAVPKKVTDEEAALLKQFSALRGEKEIVGDTGGFLGGLFGKKRR
jgi:molecular chaperone DnaJ